MPLLNSHKPKVAIIDYDMGNLFSVKHACNYVGLEVVITNRKLDLANAQALILPGVGAFGDAMHNLRNLDLVDPIKNFIHSGKPFFGICLGMQLLMTESEEFGSHKGLNIIEGKVLKFPLFENSFGKEKVPQVGWNQIFKSSHLKNNAWENSPLKGLSEEEYMYFVHSFQVIPARKEIILSQTLYTGLTYCSSLQIKNIFACQFHPERSGKKGLQIYKNLASIIRSTEA